MKCYVHPNTEAVGVCVECGRGICDACTVTVQGKSYCKNDLGLAYARVRLPVKAEEEGFKSAPLTIAGSFLLMFGALWLALGFFFIVAADNLASSLSSLSQLPFYSNLLGFTVTVAVAFGVVGCVIGAAYIASSFWVFDGVKRGALIGIALTVIMSTIEAVFASVGGFYSIASIVLNLFVLVMLAVGWDEFTPSKQEL